MTSPQQLKKEVETVRRALNIDAPERKQKAEELMKLLKQTEEFYECVAAMSPEEQKAVLAEINEYYDTVALKPIMEPFRDVLRKAAIRNLALKKEAAS